MMYPASDVIPRLENCDLELMCQEDVGTAKPETPALTNRCAGVGAYISAGPGSFFFYRDAIQRPIRRGRYCLACTGALSGTTL